MALWRVLDNNKRVASIASRLGVLTLTAKLKNQGKKKILPWFLARRKRFELLAFGSVDRRSIQLS